MSLRLGDTIISGIPTDETIKTTLIGNAVYSSDTENTRINALIGTLAATTSTYSSQRNRDRITSWTELAWNSVFTIQSGFSVLATGSGGNATYVKYNSFYRCIQVTLYFAKNADIGKSVEFTPFTVNAGYLPKGDYMRVPLGGVYAGRCYSGVLSTRNAGIYMSCSTSAITANSPIKISGMWFY